MAYPSRPPFNPNNFVDHFTTLDTTKWGQITSGTGAITTTDSYVQLASPANSACAIYYSTQLDKTKSQLWLASINQSTLDTSGFAPRFFALVNGSSAPVADTKTNIDTKTIIDRFWGGNGIRLNYYDNASASKVWSSGSNTFVSSGGAGATDIDTNARADDYYVIGLEFDGPNARWRELVMGGTYTAGYTFNQGMRMFALSDWVTWANTKASANLWFCLGNLYNNNSSSNTTKVEWVRYAEAQNNQVVDAWFDISSTRGPQATKAQTQHHWSHDGYIFVPEDRTTLALSVGGSTYDDLDISPTSMAFDGAQTDYCAYQAAGSVTTSSINFASAPHTNPQNGPWTKSASNPVITLGANETLIGFPILIPTPQDTDANKKWKLLFNVKSSIDSKWRLHLATSPGPPTTGAWTRQGMILDVGSAGAFDEKAARDLIPIHENNQWVGWYEGWDTNGYATIGRVTMSDDWLTLTKDGSGQRIGYQANGDTTLTANLTGRTVTVTSTTGFVADAWVLLCQTNTGNDYSISRVRKVISSTQLELYHGLDGFTTTTPCRITTFDAIHYWSPKVVTKVGNEWWFYFNPWGTFSSYDGANYAAYRNQLIGLWKHSNPLSSDTTPLLDQLSASVAPPGNFNNDSETVENITFLNQPFTGDVGHPKVLPTRPAPFKPMGDAFRSAKYGGWR